MYTGLGTENKMHEATPIFSKHNKCTEKHFSPNMRPVQIVTAILLTGHISIYNKDTRKLSNCHDTYNKMGQFTGIYND